MAISSKSDRLSLISGPLPEPDVSGISYPERAVFLGLYNRSVYAGNPVNERSQFIGIGLESIKVLPDADGSFSVDDRTQLLNATRTIDSGSSATTLTGLSATFSIGTLGFQQNVIYTASGVSSTGAVGSLTVGAASTGLPAGVQATAYLGLISHNITYGSLWWNGSWWNSSWWNSEWWNSASGLAYPVSGVSSITSLGTLTVTGAANFTATGVSATSQIGGLSASADTSVSAGISSVMATSGLGTLTQVGNASFTLTAVTTTGSLGSFSVNAGIGPESVSATASIGTFSVAASSISTISGVRASAFVGDPTATGYSSTPAYPVAARTFQVPSQDRTFSVPSGDRTFTVR